MLTFIQFIQEKFIKSVKTSIDDNNLAEIYENPTMDEIFKMMETKSDDSDHTRIGRVNTSEPIRGILTGGDVHTPDDVYLWLERGGMHSEIRHHIPNIKKDYIPITVNYNRMTKNLDVDVSVVQYGEREENRTKELYNKKGVVLTANRIKNSKLKDAGHIQLGDQIAEIADDFKVEI